MLAWWLERRPQLAPEEVDRIFRQLVLGALKMQERDDRTLDLVAKKITR